MKKLFVILFAFLATAMNSMAEEITVWEGEQAGNLMFRSSDATYPALMGSGEGQANLSVGDVITIYYTGASSGNKIMVQNGSWSDYSPLWTGAYDDVLAEGDGTYNIYVSQALVDGIKSQNGLLFQRGGSPTYSFTKVVVTKCPADVVFPPTNENIVYFGNETGQIFFNHPSVTAAVTAANIEAKDTVKVYMSNVDEGDKIWIKETTNWSAMNSTDLMTAGQQVFKLPLTQSYVDYITSNKWCIQHGGYDYAIRYVTIAKYVEKAETALWENEAGLADNLRFAPGSTELNSLLEMLTVGSVFTVYYTGAYATMAEDLSQKYCYHKLWFQTYDMNTTYDNATLGGQYTDALLYDEGSKDIFVTQAFIDQISTNGLTLRRGGWASFKFTKVTVSKPSTIVPGYEVLYDSDEPHPIAWGKVTYPAPKRNLLNLSSGDIVHAEWDVNSIWNEQSNNPNNLRLVYVYNGTNSNDIKDANNQSLYKGINKNDVDKTASFTLDDTSIATILSNELVFSGFYYNLTKAYIEHPSRFVEVTMSADGLATFSNATEAIDLSWVDGLKAYTATVSGDKIATERVTGTVAANTGLILQGEASTTYRIPFAAAGTALTDNVLEPTTGDAISGYVLGNTASGGTAFYKVSNKVVAAGKAYIPEGAAAARQLSLDLIGDDTTGIADVNDNDNNSLNGVYNLQGQRVSAGAKGLVIVNGKKVFNK